MGNTCIGSRTDDTFEEDAAQPKQPRAHQPRMERLAVLLRVAPPQQYLHAQAWLEEHYTAYKGHSACEDYHGKIAHKSVSGQNPHVTLMWDLHHCGGLDAAVAKFRKAFATFHSTAKCTDIRLQPTAAPDAFTDCDHVEAYPHQGWTFGHCATPEYPSMTWMEVTLQANDPFTELKRAIGEQFGASVSDEFLPHCSVCYFPHKDEQFRLQDARKLAAEHPEVVCNTAVYKGVEALLIKTGINQQQVAWPTEILDRIEIQQHSTDNEVHHRGEEVHSWTAQEVEHESPYLGPTASSLPEAFDLLADRSEPQVAAEQAAEHVETLVEGCISAFQSIVKLEAWSVSQDRSDLYKASVIAVAEDEWSASPTRSDLFKLEAWSASQQRSELYKASVTAVATSARSATQKQATKQTLVEPIKAEQYSESLPCLPLENFSLLTISASA